LFFTLKECVDAALQAVAHGEPDRLTDANVDLLRGAGEDVVPQEALVVVDAEAPLLLLRALERTEPAAAGDLEDDVGVLAHLLERDFLALVLRDEVLRVFRGRSSACLHEQSADVHDPELHVREALLRAESRVTEAGGSVKAPSRRVSAIRKWMVAASLALVAALALTVASVGSAKQTAPADFRVALVTDIGGLN
jgi:hypothetical protein